MKTKIEYLKTKFNKLPPNSTFYLVHPETIILPATAAVHYTCESFPPDTIVWIAK